MPIEKQPLEDKTIQELWGPGKLDADTTDKKPVGDTKQPPTDDKKTSVDDKKDDTKQPPVDDKTQEAAKAQERIEKLMEKHGFEDFDELIDALEEGEEFVGKLGSRDLDQLIKDADYIETMTRWQADVNRQPATKPKEDEDEPDNERVSRLEKALQDLLDERQTERDTKARREESQRVIDAFKNLVTSTLEEQEIPEAHRPFLAEFLGIDHPTLDVDLDNKVAVRKALKSGVKKYNDFITMIINNYREGKIKIPEITPTNITTPVDEPKKVENLSHARKIAAELLSGKLFKR